MQQARVFKTRIPVKRFAPALVLIFNSIAWYWLAYSLPFGYYAHHNILILGVHYVGIALAAILGASLLPRSREVGLSLWMLLGAATTILLPVIALNNTSISILISLMFGFSIGIGLPSCLAYFADVTTVENRGTYGGIAWGFVGFSVIGLALLMRGFNPAQASDALALWRFFGFAAFVGLWRIQGKVSLASVVPTFRSLLGRRDMLLYLLPWIMFSLVNFTEAPVINKLMGITSIWGTQYNLAESIAFDVSIEFAITGIFAVVGGFLADIVGRKRVIITGFVILGIDYALFSLFSGSQAVLYIYTVLDGIAWGLFAAVFFMTVWGDLAGNNQKERYYLLGGLPYLLAAFLSEIGTSSFAAIPPSTAFSLASFFLFVAVLPLMYATETLSEKRIKDLELRSYLERAKKVREKYA
jgi:MFS family permease